MSSEPEKDRLNSVATSAGDAPPVAPSIATRPPLPPISAEGAGRGKLDVGAETRIGKYVLKRLLGSGGMGHVWLALDTLAEIQVALKVLPEAFRANPEEQERLRRSFQLVQALPPHRSICQLRDLQYDETLGYFLVMEYVEGVTLSTYRSEYVKRHKSFSLAEAVRTLTLIADALDFAHARKLIHRDIKPSNVLISRDGKDLRVIDFQLAWEIRSANSRITNEKADRSGTYPYMAPEFWRGGRASALSDQYALAMLAFELLDGNLPFEATDQHSWTIIVTNPATRVPTVDNVPRFAQNALERALSLKPEDRFRSCLEFAEALGGGGIGNPKPEYVVAAKAEPRGARIVTPQANVANAEIDLLELAPAQSTLPPPVPLVPRQVLGPSSPPPADASGGGWMSVLWKIVETLGCCIVAFAIAYLVVKRVLLRSSGDMSAVAGAMVIVPVLIWGSLCLRFRRLRLPTLAVGVYMMIDEANGRVRLDEAFWIAVTASFIVTAIVEAVVRRFNVARVRPTTRIVLTLVNCFAAYLTLGYAIAWSVSPVSYDHLKMEHYSSSVGGVWALFISLAWGMAWMRFPRTLLPTLGAGFAMIYAISTSSSYYNGMRSETALLLCAVVAGGIVVVEIATRKMVPKRPNGDA